MHKKTIRVGWTKVRKHIAMFYLIIGFPGVLAYMVLHYLTDFTDQVLVLSLIPMGVLLVLIYIAYLVNPYRFSWEVRKQESK